MREYRTDVQVAPKLSTLVKFWRPDTANSP